MGYDEQHSERVLPDGQDEGYEACEEERGAKGFVPRSILPVSR